MTKEKPNSLLRCIETVLAAASAPRYALGEVEHVDYAKRIIEYRLTTWANSQINPIKGADEAVKNLCEIVIRPQRIDALKLEIKRLQAQIAELEK